MKRALTGLLLALGVVAQAQIAGAQASYDMIIPGVDERAACMKAAGKPVMTRDWIITTCYGAPAAALMQALDANGTYRFKQVETKFGGVYNMMYLQAENGNDQDRCWQKTRNANGSFPQGGEYGCEFYTPVYWPNR